MPNYCNNELTLAHANPAMIARAKLAFDQMRFLQEFVPMPAELKGTKAPSDNPNWYDWRVASWGTKWDVGGDAGDHITDNENGSVTFSFESAWAPPAAVYPVLEGFGFFVRAYWFEPGMGFAGKYCAKQLEEFNLDDPKDVAAIPADLDEAMGISESLMNEGDE